MADKNSHKSVICPDVDFAANPQDHLASIVIQSMSESAVTHEKRMLGQTNLEMGDMQGLNVMFCCYPSGDLYVWFIEVVNFILIAKVDGIWKCIAVMGVDYGNEFYKALNDVANAINMKNNYPIEHPEHFQPSGSGDNPPDQSNG
jgi:hypothetical protein